MEGNYSDFPKKFYRNCLEKERKKKEAPVKVIVNCFILITEKNHVILPSRKCRFL